MGLFDRNPEGGALVAPMAQSSGGGGGGSGATTALDNLASVAVNASIVPNLDVAIDLGSGAKNWATGYIRDLVSTTSLMLDADGGEVFMWSTDEVFALKSYNGVVAPTLRFWDKDEGFYVGLKSPDTLAATQTYVLPATSANGVLTNTGGVLSWVASSGFDPNTSPVQFLNAFVEMRDDAGDWWSGSNTKIQNGNAMADNTLVIGTRDLLTGGDVKKNLTLLTGTQDGGPNGGTGQFDILTGHVWAGTGSSGNFFIETGGIGSGVTGNSGTFDIQTGDNGGTGNTGAWNFRTGHASAGNSGSISFQIGTASGVQGTFSVSAPNFSVNTTGSIGNAHTLDLGGPTPYAYLEETTNGAYIQMYASTPFSDGGNVSSSSWVEGGQFGNMSVVSYDGDLDIYTRGSSHASGNVFVGSGNAGGNNSGNLTLRTGTSSATRGKIKIVDGSEGTVGHVWTQTNADGSGAWQAAGGGGANTTLSNLGTTSINADLLPSAAFTRSIGSGSLPWSNIHTKVMSFYDSGPLTSVGFIDADGSTVPSGTSAHFVILTTSASVSQHIALHSNSLTGAAASGSVFVESGNQNSTLTPHNSGPVLIKSGNVTSGTNNGNSGTITLQTGTVAGGGSRGNIILNAPAVVPTGTMELGSNASHWDRVWTNDVLLKDGSSLMGLLNCTTSGQTLPSGNTAHSYFANADDSVANNNLAFYSLSSASIATKPLFVETGNQTSAGGTLASGALLFKTGNITNAGNGGGSGGITIQTGTVAGGGTRGNVTLDARVINLTTTNGLAITGTMSPNAAVTHNLGAPTASWNILYTRFVLGRSADFAVGTDFNTGFAAVFQSGHSNTSTATGNALFQSGDQLSSGTGTVGTAIFRSGNTASGNSNATGATTLKSGDAAGSGASGAVTVSSGTSASSTTGAVTISSGDAAGGNSGGITIQSGTATGTRGQLTVNVRSMVLTNAPLGSDWLPDATATRSLGNTSTRFLLVFSNAFLAGTGVNNGGRMSNALTTPSGADAFGVNSVEASRITALHSSDTGTASTHSGNVLIESGNATGTTSNSGDIALLTGTATGTRGKITLSGNGVDASASTNAFRAPNLASDPASPQNGDIWYNTTSNELKCRANGTTVVLA